jgi:hypothetical protein
MGVYINSNEGSSRMSLHGKRFDMKEKKVIVTAQGRKKVYDRNTQIDTVLKWASQFVDEESKGNDYFIPNEIQIEDEAD